MTEYFGETLLRPQRMVAELRLGYSIGTDMVGKSSEFGKLLAGKCWYLEGNFGIWREIAGGNCTFLYTKTYKLCLNLEACLPGN